ncbi:hypothetical protein ACFVJK_36830 [Streptomyces sp. NPDC127172]|uniref:hypothetical protein n=1 Tax=Streptomyces sp. NPDC127172 TaxID=3345382 RepID=UPI003625C26E
MSEQLSRADLAAMSPEAITEARRSGRLNVILGRQEATTNEVLDVIERDQAAASEAEPTGRSAALADGQLSREDLDTMSPADIVKAKRKGRLNALLGRS